MIRIGLVLGIVIALLPGSSRGAEEPFQILIGTASVDITPEFPVRLSGYGSRATEASEVAQRIHAKALAIGDEAGDGPIVLVTVELLGVTTKLREQALAKVNQHLKLQNARFMLCATHTHSAPTVEGLCPLILGDTVTPDQQSRIQKYTEQVVDKIAEVTLAAWSGRRPGVLHYGAGSVDFAANRRVIKDASWSGFGVQPQGPVDHRLQVLVAKDADNRLVAVLANYACHCTTLGGEFNKICGDWAGFAAETIQQRHPGAVALISIGCGADSNPNPRGGDDQGYALARKHGKTLAAEVERLLNTDLDALHGPIGARMTSVPLPFAQPRSEQEWSELASQPGHAGVYGRRYLELVQNQAPIPASIDYPVAAIRFGEDLVMLFLAGEVVVDYAIRLQGELQGRPLWITAYANDVPCYIPSRRILREGGYEADQSMIYYGQPNRFDPAVEDVIVNEARRILDFGF